jgi:hypothetical protein
VLLGLKLLLQSWKSTNRQVVMKFLQKLFRQEAKCYCLRSTNSLTLFGIRKNCLIREGVYCGVIKLTNNYHGITLLSTSYKNFLSRLSPYIDEIIGDHQCGFRHNRSATDQTFCIRQILGEKNGITMRQYMSYSYTSRKPMIQWEGRYCTIFS